MKNFILPILAFSLLVGFSISCKKDLEIVKNPESTLDGENLNLKNTTYTYFEIPSEYEAGSEAELTEFTFTEVIYINGEEQTVLIKIELSDDAIGSISCNVEWVNEINLPLDFILTEQSILDELDVIMEEAQQKAPGWWTKFKKWVRRVVSGCSGTFTSVNPATGQCLQTNAHYHWLTGAGYGGAGVAVEGQCNTGYAWNEPCN